MPRAEVTHPLSSSFSWEPAWESETESNVRQEHRPLLQPAQAPGGNQALTGQTCPLCLAARKPSSQQGCTVSALLGPGPDPPVSGTQPAEEPH